MDKLQQTASYCGDKRKYRYYLNGKQISARYFRRLFDVAGLFGTEPHYRKQDGQFYDRALWMIKPTVKDRCEP